jgi:hypothetical protein
MSAAASPATRPARLPSITITAAPRREPPFDDELPPRHLRLIASHEPQLPFEELPRHRLSAAQDSFAAQMTARGSLPDPESFGRRLLVAVFEALSGRRPLPQLGRFLSPGVYTGLATDLDRARPDSVWSKPTVMRSIRVCEPADGVAELAAVVQTGPRYRAVAVRLEGLDGRWRCVRLQLG